MKSHTPGPWEPLDQLYWIGNRNSDSGVCKVVVSPDSESEDLANMKLIMAAPDMLEALEYILSEVYSRPDLSKYMDTIGPMKGLAAINKARGEK